MADFALPALFALFIWWFSTGAILWLDGLPARTYRISMAGATLVLAAALWGLSASAADPSVLGAYCAFSCGLLAWAWQEMAFLMGYATGPSRAPCPPDTTGWRRFTLALRAILYHELAIIAGAVAVVAATWDQPNQIGTWTYLLIWGMRQSAKLNVFLGARNLNENFLPPHLRYLGSFFLRRPMNLLFPFAVTLATLLTALLFHRALAPGATDFQAAGFTFLGTLAALATLEHWFLVLPIPAEALWDWGLRSREAPKPAQPELHPARFRAGPAPAA
ncbi:putative photosynthetic complex assembly protein PuhE [Dankookia sp. P2]|uniref:putative photosynthetic complex assembly protein PuhE n=1 Tax=Dankookia sp. P2 TaxID=3423955 RepID=UPI003D66CBCE